MRSFALAIIVFLASVQTAQAGAWLREEGSGFTSSTSSITQEREPSGSVYFEYGLREKATLGLDVSFGLDRTGAQSGSGTVFLRFPWGPTDGNHKWAWHVGLGGRYLNGLISPAIETGASWGRGIQIGERYGWAAIDGSINFAAASAETRAKLDTTIGLGFTDHFKGMAQMFMTYQESELFTKLAPSLLIQPGKGTYTLQIGAELPVTGGGSSALKIGIWRDF